MFYEQDISNCRRLSYDNSHHISGKYNGMQANIFIIPILLFYIIILFI